MEGGDCKEPVWSETEDGSEAYPGAARSRRPESLYRISWFVSGGRRPNEMYNYELKIIHDPNSENKKTAGINSCRSYLCIV